MNACVKSCPVQGDDVQTEADSAAACDPAGHPAPAVEGLGHDVSIFLIGMMGAGKTTIGRSLARALGREFIDLDHELEARCGVRVQMIFEIEGEAGFRRRECVALAECAVRRNVVLATGGGAILAPENRKVLQENGIVVYLRADVDELYRRTCRDRSRPLLATADPRGTLRDLLIRRDPLYREVADLVIDTGCAPVASLVKSMLAPLAAVGKRL